MAGVVFYPAGSIPFFQKDTIVQPENRVALWHSNLAKQHVIKDLTILGNMPANFSKRLIGAVLASETMSPKEQRLFLDVLLEQTS